MGFEEAYDGYQCSRLRQSEAAALPGVCERTFRHYIDRYHSALAGMMVHQGGSMHQWVGGIYWRRLSTETGHIQSIAIPNWANTGQYLGGWVLFASMGVHTIPVGTEILMA